jgi:osmotically inducible lipoprotein OsmB
MRHRSLASFWNRFFRSAIAGAALIAVAGCYGQPLSTREKGTLAGGAIGAGSGAIVGAAVGAPLAGAAIGGVVGAGTGMAIGNSIQNNENQQRYAD